jgi:hypothetical protein
VFGISWLAYALLALGLAIIAFAIFAPARPAQRTGPKFPDSEPEPQPEPLALTDAMHALLEGALRSQHVSERMLAVEFADALDDQALLEAGLHDEELGVAAAATYALKRRMNGSLWNHVRNCVPAERAEALAERIRLLN